ncbi:phosphate ABC transporter, permease protein PstA [Gottschalkia purinilytica]|uniref:Phosphate transport system permease protein PstA n=1 Tax=Gottschalkia purinilytica TaxID=1503 RepID=A0A0L0WEN0_GOTPU|nr:phosphate ABC transporter permease PstA [Gottschalkia purinilytica]KNF09937.1 phosphate ABC transporter, permease protein PstA [Gottschalkia purinilytica]
MSNLKRRKIKNKIFHALVFASTLFGVIILAVLLFDIFKDGLKWINFDFFNNFTSRIPTRAGIKAPLLGSLWIILLTTVIAFPVGVGTAIYLEEYAKKNWITNIIQVNISNLAGVPSIVFGILGLAVFVNMFGFGRSILSGALTLALLILPVIIVSSQEALRSVPTELKQGAYALGMTKWKVVTGVVLPYSMPSILTGGILSISRALGETAPLIMVGAVAFVAFTPKSIFDSFSILPMQIYSWTSRPQEEFHGLAAAGIIVLLVILFLSNAIAIILRNKYEDRLKG